MNSIKHKNIHVIPSIHYSPQFAKMTKIVFDKIKPDVIAVELPSNCKDRVIEAVKLLPVISAVYHEKEESVYSFIPVIPTDSLIESIRLGVDCDIPVKFIDLNISIKIPPLKKPLLDDVSIETIGLDEYYELSKDSMPGVKKNSGNDLREEVMVFHLQNLMKKYKRVLFVCGMAHWERIKKRLETENSFYEHSICEKYEIGILDLKVLEYELGIFPYNAYFYELNRKENSYEWVKCIYALYKNCDKKKELSTKGIKDMIKYGRNQALLQHKITPSLYQVVMSAKQMEEDEYASKVLTLARTYEFQKKTKNLSLPVIGYDPDKMMAQIGGKTKKINLRVPNYKGQGKIGLLKKLKLKSKSRDHPYDKGHDSFDSTRWGRFGDEMKRETDFIFSLENRWNEVNGTDDDYETYKFTGGLMDGIDYRTIVRNFHEKKIYVKKDLDDYIDFSIILFEFISVEEEEDYGYLDFCYQFGKTPKMFHYGFGITSPERNLGNGTGQYDWLYLASLKKETDIDFVGQRCEDCYHNYTNGVYDNGLETVRHVAVENAPGRNILIVGTDKISGELQDHAKLKNKKLYFLNKDSINKELAERNFTYNVYYKAVK